MSTYSLWTLLGTLYLVVLTYKDVRQNRLVDDRYNWFMMGLTIALTMIVKRPFLYIIVILVITALMVGFLVRYAKLGSADGSTFLWSFVGFGIIGPYGQFVLWYALSLLFFSTLYYGVKRFIIRERRETPFYPVILLSYVLTCLTTGIY